MEHVVRWGEHLTAIARRYGVTVQAIVEANGIANPSAIYAGQVLVIPGAVEDAAAVGTAAATMVPAPTPTPFASPRQPTETIPASRTVEHVVRAGENLTSIARRYGTTVQALAEANGIVNPSAIYIGQVLVIPGATSDVPPAPMVTPTVAPTPTPAASAEGQAEIAGRRIAFQVSSGGDIWSVGADGSGLARLTHGLDPAWSPDGRQLAFVRWDEPRGLYVLDVGAGQERLVRGGNLIKRPTWAPGGDLLAFSWQSSGAEPTRLCFPGFGCIELPGQEVWSLAVVDLEGNTRTDPAADQRSFCPSWSPRGDWIAYQGENGLKATAPGQQPWVILNDVAAVCPEVAPDGQRLVFMYRQHDHWEIYTALSDGTGLRPLTQASPLAERPAENVAPTWSPDGSQVLFLSDRDGRWRPYIMEADGSGQRPFLPEVFDRFDFRYEFAAERVFTWR
ncbi:MAG: LysM peptidoglycan-binding domain-containing protein [Anaerolineae bacterium]|nr:LysM peptidoglycan-binding domain-containing protein [Anaerolineae bacterium]